MKKRQTTSVSKGKLRSSYITLIISISLVLFLLGILGLVIINASALNDYFRESLSFSVMLDDQVKEADIRMLQKDLDAKQYVKFTEYISKEEAAAKLQEDLGEDFLNFLGYNPLSPTIDVFLYSSYTHPDSVLRIEKYILEYPYVKEVFYQESILHLINDNVRKISLFILVMSSFLFFISVTIINNTIRLSVYSKRFIIRTMQLVGATRAFIRRPFVVRSIAQGIISALLAMIMLSGMLYLIEKEFIIMFAPRETNMLILLAAGLIITGVIVNMISTHLAVNRYLSITDDKLYF